MQSQWIGWTYFNFMFNLDFYGVKDRVILDINGIMYLSLLDDYQLIKLY